MSSIHKVGFVYTFKFKPEYTSYASTMFVYLDSYSNKVILIKTNIYFSELVLNNQTIYKKQTKDKFYGKRLILITILLL